MKDEEMADKHAEEYRKTFRYYRAWHGLVVDKSPSTIVEQSFKDGFLAGLKAGRPQWHKVADGDLPKGDEYGKNSIHRDIYLKDRYGNLYTGNYFPKDETHTEDCFAVEVLEWGFQGSQFCKKEQISEWCEIPTFDKE